MITLVGTTLEKGMCMEYVEIEGSTCVIIYSIYTTSETLKVEYVLHRFNKVGRQHFNLHVMIGKERTLCVLIFE